MKKEDVGQQGNGTFLARKDIVFSLQRYGVEALGAMALGLFSSLIVGLILRVIGEQLGLDFLVDIGLTASKPELMGAAIGVAVAFGLKSPPFVLFASAITGATGALLGGPAGAFVAALIGAEFGKLVSKETKVDLIVTPAVTLIMGITAGNLIGPGIAWLMREFGSVIMSATELHPIPMGILVAVLMGLALTAPISSAALAIMMELGGIAAGAATVGCAAQMVGFAVTSYRDNGPGGLIAQGLGTSMLQIPNIIKNPRILVPPTLAAAVLGPMVTTLFPMTNSAIGAGMGTAGLVGQFATVDVMGIGALPLILIFHFIMPASISLLFASMMRRQGWIKAGDMKLDL
ncbi:MAG: PTS sugar transporter subunit IIC [Bacillota bacterium]|nr:PTS sugar transporter subunit IIC [Bacillota bacterium]